MNRLRELRLERQLTQTQTAQLLGLPLNAYQRIEWGQRKRIPLSLICRMADFYEVSIDYMMGRWEERI